MLFYYEYFLLHPISNLVFRYSKVISRKLHLNTNEGDNLNLSSNAPFIIEVGLNASSLNHFINWMIIYLLNYKYFWRRPITENII